ncbi:MAG: sterol desaturase family protein [Rubricella sp.]
MELIDFADAALSRIVGVADNPNLRFFYIYLAFGMLIAVLAHRFSRDERSFSEVFFARDVWLSRSAINDYAVMVLNPMIYLVMTAWLVSHFAVLQDWIASGIRFAGVSGEVTDANALLLAGALTLSLYVVNDFVRWWVHYLQHRIPFLWEFHKVHHSAEHLNFATAERHHPVDVLLFMLIMTISISSVNGIFIGFFGEQLTVITVSGANVLWFASNIIGGVLRHSPIWVRFGPRVERWLISPAMHHIHHSDDPRHFDKNMGGSLAIWDRMAGTLYIPSGREVSGYGLGEETPEYRSLLALYALPFRKAWAVLRGRKAQDVTPAE